MSDYIIRPLTVAEVQHAVDWAGREGWNPGVHDAECFRQTDPGGFLGGFLNGEMIASVSAVNYNDHFAFLGFYIVKPEFRRHGHGLEIAQHALAHCAGRNMGLDGVVEQQDNYRKSGFTFAYNNYRFAGTKTLMLAKLDTSPNNHIADLNSASDALKAYDRNLFPAPRDLFLDSWLSAFSHVSKVYSENGNIRGYATLRPCLTGYKVGPLFADSTDIAKALLNAVLSSIPEDHTEHEVFVDMPQPNASAFALADEIGLDKVFETARMYSSHQPDIDLDRIFGVTTFELG
ncbi:GNAT family N-acetyltransferase [uncultured Ruegeria sp.]|uniref:GNAT family N-acetyltransferase n=1 Tax=uncultured Ruegeria sp. TaxID=259304 RepID=UPI00262F2E8B|nr:GNAT family N-acetyltransferase [uncultured Ruegeria sp.]